jgi:hypothetical protein
LAVGRTGTLAFRVAYDAYGEARHLPAKDINGDGKVDKTDTTIETCAGYLAGTSRYKRVQKGNRAAPRLRKAPPITSMQGCAWQGRRRDRRRAVLALGYLHALAARVARRARAQPFA